MTDGLAWSSCPTEAAWYAAQRAEQGAAPVIVRRVVPREEVLWRWALDGGEFITASSAPLRVHTDDPERIRKLARTGQRRNTALVGQWATIVRRYMDGRDFWGGWGLEGAAG